MRVLKSIAVAFSMYSKIPMPKFNWASQDMKYHLIFFPWVGAVIGIIEYYLQLFCLQYNISKLVFTLLALTVPLIVTGGFHLDGFMDTSDALASYQDKEKRLEILKDPHVGAFAIIRLIIYGLLFFSSIYSMNEEAFNCFLFTFFISRVISGICVITNKKAKTNGLLNTESATAHNQIVVVFLAAQFIIVSVIAGLLFDYLWTICLFGALLSLLYYIYVAHSKFGGITGDLAGWFVCNCELMGAVGAALFSIFV